MPNNRLDGGPASSTGRLPASWVRGTLGGIGVSSMYVLVARWAIIVVICCTALCPDSAAEQRIQTDRDPRYNSSINAQYNPSLNPRYNSSIDPARSRRGGYFIFNLHGDAEGIAVRPQPTFLLLFNLQGTWTGLFASNGGGAFNWFSTEPDWKGYILSNSAGGFNLFSVDSEWLGYLN